MSRPVHQILLSSLRRGAGSLWDLLLPEVCGACGAAEPRGGGLCGPCGEALLSMVALPYCPRCGATIGPNIPIRDDGCAACPATLPRFATVVRLGPYGRPLRSIVQELKYHKREQMLDRLGEMLAQALRSQTEFEQFDVILPVPMHWRRRIVRGFDHARTLARSLSGQLDLPVGDELIRVRPTGPQVRLSRTQRIENVHGAFAIASAATIEGAHVLLVDDVTTTGATANEAARTLLSGGAGRVTLAVVAKAEPPSAYADHWN